MWLCRPHVPPSHLFILVWSKPVTVNQWLIPIFSCKIISATATKHSAGWRYDGRQMILWKKNRETAKATAYSGRNPGKGENNATFNFLPRFVLNTWYPTFNYQKWEGVSTGSRVREVTHQGMHAWSKRKMARDLPDLDLLMKVSGYKHHIHKCTTIPQP